MLQFSYFQVLLLIAAAAAVCAAVYVSQHRKYLLGSAELTVVFGAVAILSVFSIFAHMFVDLDEKLLLTKLGYVSYTVIISFWTVFLFKILLRNDKRSRDGAVAIYVFAAICALVAFFDPAGAFYGEASLIEDGNIVYLSKASGEAFYAWCGAMALLVVLMYAFAIYGRRKSILSKEQFWATVAALTLPVILGCFYHFDITALNWTPIGMTISTLLISYTLHRQFLPSLPTANRQVFAALRDGVIELDGTDQLIQINSAARSILGVSDNASGDEIVSLIINQFTIRTDEGIIPQSECEYIDEWGKVKRLSVNVSELVDKNKDRNGMLIFIRDDTDYRHQQEMLNYLENYDGVTGLPNRKMFMDLTAEQLEKRSTESNEKMAIVVCNIDRFREYNEIYGLDFGDRLLQHFAGLFKKYIREGDVCARSSADEFYLLIPALREDGAEYYVGRMLTRIMRELEYPIFIDNQRINASLRAGVSICPDDLGGEETADSLMTLAAAAMESAKHLGKNQYCFYSSELRAKVEERFSLTQDMFEALDEGQFYVVYQPQIDYAENRVVGVEALCRWEHPKRGNIPPCTFIPIAEDTGLISSLGLFVTEEVCKLAAEWVANGLEDMKFSINLSIRQLLSDTIADRIIAIVGQYAISPDNIVFEVTESIAMTNEIQVIKQLNKLRDYGFGIAIDDFAMGHSSFLYLKKFSVSTLKIDKVLSQNVQSDAVSLAVIHSLCVLSESLGTELIVEFVETREQLELLVEQGCRVFQGYYYSPPLAPENCLEYIEAFSEQVKSK